MLSDHSPEVVNAFTTSCHEQFVQMLEAANAQKESAKVADKVKAAQVQPDDLITFRSLRCDWQQLSAVA